MTDSEVKKKVEPSLVAICDEEREVVGEGAQAREVTRQARSSRGKPGGHVAREGRATWR